MPMPGDVDIVIASELMEAGRAVQRGLVTPDRTTLIASTHRVFAMTERIAMADGRVDAPVLLEACRNSAKSFFGADLAAAAERTGSVISAVLFGALAQIADLAVRAEAFEATIERAGVGVAASKRGFAAGVAGRERGCGRGRRRRRRRFARRPGGASFGEARPERRRLCSRRSSRDAESDLPAAALRCFAPGSSASPIIRISTTPKDYLLRLKPVVDAERRHGDGSGRLIAETARELALGMAYEDTIRVAELKVRASALRAGARGGARAA